MPFKGFAIYASFLLACLPRPTGVAIPSPLTVSVDDCGWQSGSSLDAKGGPWRLGARDPTLDDYRRLARIARASGTRLLTLWVLSELDRSNLCARPEYNLPLAPSDMTEQGLAWDNRTHVGGENFALMDLMRTEAAVLEFGLHGVRHEHFEYGKRQRAEFGGRDGSGFGMVDTLTHLRCFQELLRQYYPEEVNPFPISFVPPNHGYGFRAGDRNSTGTALAAFGVKYVQRPGPMRVDNGVLLLDRDTEASPAYNKEGGLPEQPDPKATVVMTHLPNFYGSEKEWVDWLAAVDTPLDRVLPKNTGMAVSQMLYADHARLYLEGDRLILDLDRLPPELSSLELLGPLMIKIEIGLSDRFSVDVDQGVQVVATYRDRHGHGIALLAQPEHPRGRLSPGRYTLRVHRDQDPGGDFVRLGKTTFNVFWLRRDPTGATLALELFGRQVVEVVLNTMIPSQVRVDNPGLRVDEWRWSPAEKTLRVPIEATNMQGERGWLRIDSELIVGAEVATP